MSDWLSDKAVRYILSPKRGMCTDINPDISQPITAKGQMNWTGTFISPDIIRIDRNGEINGGGTTTIYLASGDVIEYDGKTVKKIP